MRQLVVGADESGQRLDKYLRRLLPEAGTSFLYKMLRRKNITLNGARAEGGAVVRAGDVVTVFFSDETFAKFSGEGAGSTDETESLREGAGTRPKAETEAYLRAFSEIGSLLPPDAVLYEDRNVLIADKPQGIQSQKSRDGDVSMNEWFIGRLLARGEITPEGLRHFTPSVCNRLDRGTGGLIAFGKTLPGSRGLTALFRERGVKKEYLAAVHGRIEAPGRIEGWIEKDERTNRVTLRETETEEGRYSLTRYVPLSVTGERAPRTLVLAELVTGRPHQLRCHFAHIGHPVAGDVKYGDRALDRAMAAEMSAQGERYPAQLLFCHRLTFPADTGELAELSGRIVEAAVPEALTALFPDAAAACHGALPPAATGAAR